MESSLVAPAVHRFFAFFAATALLLPVACTNAKDVIPVRVAVSCNEVAEIVKTMPRGTASDLRIDRVSGEVERPDGTRKPGCIVSAHGEVHQDVNESLPHERLREMMSTRGWTEMPRYAADSSDGTSFALSRNGVLCFFNSTWMKEPEGTYRFTAVCVERADE